MPGGRLTSIYGGLPTPSGGTALTTITLANTSATEQSAGFVSPMFGLPLKQGDVPAGQYPAFFLSDDTPVPATIHSVTSWPDGSMKWCGVFLRVPTTVAGSGTLAITVKNGGSAPGSSARAVSDLTAADLTVELTGVTNLTGTWTASLNDAITNGTVVVIGDGPAGMLVRILGDFKQSGGAHGQLVCWHYALIAQNSSGGLLGIRYLGRAALPWANVTSPAPARLVVNAALKSGASTIRTLQGYDTTETVGVNIGMAHYSSFFTAGADAKWDFVQGGGSATSDCTVRVIHDSAYVLRSHLNMPFDLSVSATDVASVDYAPYGSGGMQRTMSTTGERADIGILTGWHASHSINQSAVNERRVRAIGMAASGWQRCFRKSDTKQPVAVIDIQAGYTGLGTVETGWRFSGSGTQGTLPNPVVSSGLWVEENAHRPSATYYAHLITGEPQYLDLCVENAVCSIAEVGFGDKTWSTTLEVTNPKLTSGNGRGAVIGATTYKAGGIYFDQNLMRIPAWRIRDIAQGLALYPDTCPSGTAIKSYLADVLNNAVDAGNAYNDALPQSWRDNGLHTFSDPSQYFEAPWCSAYMNVALVHAGEVLGRPTNIRTLAGHYAKFWKAINASAGFAAMCAPRALGFVDGLVRAGSIDGFKFCIADNGVSFESGSSVFTLYMTGTNVNTDDWAVTNGDVFTFYGGTKPFAEATDGRNLYAVEAAGRTFKLATTPGGSPITATTTGTSVSAAANGRFWGRMQSFAPNVTYQGFYGPMVNLTVVRSTLKAINAAGVADMTAELAGADAALTTSGASFSTEPKYAYAATYPG